jgi:IS30 family transposase
MKYKHLTAAQRGVIEGLLHNQNCTVKYIAGVLGVASSTVSREINKRSAPEGYFAKVAQIDYERNRRRCRAKSKMRFSKRQKYVTGKLQLGWSPEQISGRLKLEEKFDLYICPETIYQWLYTNDWAKREEFCQYLRYGREKRKKQTGRSVHRSKIPNRVSIHQRPKIVERRKQLGHWEGDSVIYPNKYAINTLNELKTGLVEFTKLKRKTAKLTAKAMINCLKQHHARTVTVDNGSEFTTHELVAIHSGTKVFFADPYSSWQRGSNENANMLLRGYLPKRCDIADLTQEELNDIANELNNRPRKRLGFQTPNEVYYHYLNQKRGSMIALGVRI